VEKRELEECGDYKSWAVLAFEGMFLEIISRWGEGEMRDYFIAKGHNT
jgi:hypothetical protein